jgi:uncharacterized protein involved in exopolysaccharide biosynthesis
VEDDVVTRVEAEVRSGERFRPGADPRRSIGTEPQDPVVPAPTGWLIPEESEPPCRSASRWRERLLFGTLQLLWRHRVLVVGTILLTASAGFVTARLRSPYYVARATIFPPPMEGSIAGIGLASVAGLVGNLGLSSGSASLFPLYETFAYSRTVVTGILNQPLDEVGFPGTLLERIAPVGTGAGQDLDAAIEIVRRRLTFEADKKTGVVSISYLDTDPKVAALVTNQVVDALDHFDLQTATSRAGERRQFIEQRMNQSARTLAEAEGRLEQFRQENLRIGNAPGLLLDQARLQREVEIEQQIYLTLRKEYELARIDEQRSVPVVSVLDRAVAPVVPAGPSLVKLTVAAGFLGACLVVGSFALVALQPRRTLEDILQAARLR